MKDEYIIINKTQIIERIDELDKQIEYYTNWYNKAKENNSREEMRVVSDYSLEVENEIKILNNILSQSTSLLPEIEKAYDAGKLDKELSLSFDNPKGRYISSLKLDI